MSPHRLVAKAPPLRVISCAGAVLSAQNRRLRNPAPAQRAEPSPGSGIHARRTGPGAGSCSHLHHTGAVAVSACAGRHRGSAAETLHAVLDNERRCAALHSSDWQWVPVADTDLFSVSPPDQVVDNKNIYIPRVQSRAASSPPGCEMPHRSDTSP